MNPQFTPYRRSAYHVGDDDGQGSTSQAAATNELFQDSNSTSNTNPSVEQLMAMMMNLMQGMQSNQNSNKAPFKLVPPEPYSGIRSPKIIDTWLFSVREHLKLANISSDHAVAFAASLLRDNAKAWWRSLSSQNKIPANYEDFETLLQTAFRPSDSVRSARNQLASLQQNGSVQAYVVRFRDLLLEIPDVSEAEALDRFIRGLRDKTRLEVEHRDPSSLEDAIKIAERFDSIVFSQKMFPQHQRAFYPPSSIAHNVTGPTPMEVDELKARSPRQRMDETEKAELRKRGACFVCKKVGHIARNCPEKSLKSFGQTGNARIQ
jgi:hypothetical protein